MCSCPRHTVGSLHVGFRGFMEPTQVHTSHGAWAVSASLDEDVLIPRGFWTWPLNLCQELCGPLGNRVHCPGHQGLCLFQPHGRYVWASGDGVVRRAGPQSPGAVSELSGGFVKTQISRPTSHVWSQNSRGGAGVPLSLQELQMLCYLASLGALGQENRV